MFLAGEILICLLVKFRPDSKEYFSEHLLVSNTEYLLVSDTEHLLVSTVKITQLIILVFFRFFSPKLVSAAIL